MATPVGRALCVRCCMRSRTMHVPPCINGDACGSSLVCALLHAQRHHARAAMHKRRRLWVEPFIRHAPCPNGPWPFIRHAPCPNGPWPRGTEWVAAAVDAALAARL
eukprot:350080-Chlamydomonas_euryale.AAC.3